MSDELWSLIRFGRADARGRAQKLPFIREAGREGKAAAISDLLEETGLSESSCYLIDDTAEVLDEVSSYLPQVSCAQIKFPRKPAVQSADIPQRKWLVDTFPLVEDWLRC